MTDKERVGSFGENLSEGDKKYVENHGWNKPGDLIAAYRDLEEHSVLLPRDNQEESWRKFYTSVGCPECAEDYDFHVPDDLPENFPYSEELEALVRKWCHSAGLSSEQARKLYSSYMNYIVSKYEDACEHEKENMERAKQMLRMRWGKSYQKNIELGRSAMQYLGGRKLPSILEANGLGNNPEVVETFVKLGQTLREDRAIPDMEITNLTPDQALKEREKLQDDPSFFRAYLDASDPDHESALAKMQLVNKVIAGY